MNSRRNSYFIYLLLFIAIIAMIVYNFSAQSANAGVINLNQVAMDLKNHEIESITIDENNLRVYYKNDSRPAESTKDPTTPLVDQLIQLGVSSEDLSPEHVDIEIKPPSAWVGILTILGYIIPFLILGAAFLFIFRQAQGGNNAAMSFGKSRARMFNSDHPTVTFKDVAGVDEAREELEEVVEFLREPQKFIALGARIPKGVLLVGAPGTGKTLMGTDAPKVDIETICKSVGIKHLWRLNPMKLDELEKALRDSYKINGPAVIITEYPCQLYPTRLKRVPMVVDPELCNGCGACLRIGCPAILTTDELSAEGLPKVTIDADLCTGCEVCAWVCKPDAIKFPVSEEVQHD